MKKSILILATIAISLIGVNAQQNICEKKGKVIIQEKTNQELYSSIVRDFEDWYRETTEEEMTDDNENLDLYNNLYESFELLNNIDSENNEDKENDNLYSSLKEDLETFKMLSIAEIQF